MSAEISLLASLHVQILQKVNAKRTKCTPYYKFVCSGVERLLHPKVLENKRVRMMKMVGEHVSRGWLGCMQCSSTVVRPFSMAVVSISNGSKYARWLVRIGAGILYVR